VLSIGTLFPDQNKNSGSERENGQKNSSSAQANPEDSHKPGQDQIDGKQKHADVFGEVHRSSSFRGRSFTELMVCHANKTRPGSDFAEAVGFGAGSRTATPLFPIAD
jgi:hypothetical protein